MAQEIIYCTQDTYASFGGTAESGHNMSGFYGNEPSMRVMMSLEDIRKLSIRANTGVAIMQFNIPKFENKRIEKAELKVCCEQRYKGVTVSAFRFNIPIEANSINGSMFRRELAFNDMEKSPTEHLTDYSNNGLGGWFQWYAWDVTSIVQNSKGEARVSLVLVDTDNTNKTYTTYPWWFKSKESGYTPYVEVTYNDAVPDLPTILYPNGDVIEKGNALTFQWKHNSLYDTGQTKYDFGWRQQGNASWTEALGVVSTVQSHTLDTNSMPTGIVEWRVRTYNANNAVSEYAYGAFELTGRPTAPIIDTMKNDAITEIAWRSNEAETAIFRIWIYQGATLVHDSGEMPGGLTSSYIPNMMFTNGQYTVKMRIGSVYGVWSDESAKVFTISAAIPSTPDITLSATHGGVLVATSSTASDKIVYRSEDGTTFTPIGRFSGLTYIDYAMKSGKMYEYFIRAHSGSYADSGKRPMKIKYKGALLSDVNTPGNYIEIYKSDSDWFNSIKTKHSNESELIKYEGRTYPVKESGIHKETEIGTSFYLSNSNAEKIETLYGINGIYLFRNSEVCFCCEISSFDYENTLFNIGKNVEISLSRIDYSLEVRFDV